MLQKNWCNVLFPPVWFAHPVDVFGRVGLTCPPWPARFFEIASIVSVGNQNSDGRDPLSWLKIWGQEWLGGSYQIHLDLEPVSTTSSTIDYINMAHNNTYIKEYHSIIKWCHIWLGSKFQKVAKIFSECWQDLESQRSGIAGSPSRRWPVERAGPNCALDGSRGQKSTCREES